MKRRKAPGPDDIPIDLIQRSPPLQQYLIEVIRQFWSSETIDDSFSSGDQLMIYKKGDRSLHRNFRPITLLNHSFKTLTNIINQRLLPIITDTINNLQNGFRPGRSTTLNLYALLSTIRNYTSYQAPSSPTDSSAPQPPRYNPFPSLATFVDFSKAFDTLHHNWIWLSLREHNVPDKLIRLIQVIYNSASVSIKERNERSERIPIRRGVLQGDSLSPSLFIIGLDSLLNRLLLPNSPLPYLAYADDIVFLHHSGPQAEDTLNDIADLAEQTGLHISTQKTKLLRLHNIPTPPVTDSEVNARNFKVECPVCTRGFDCTRSLKLHLTRWCMGSPALKHHRKRRNTVAETRTRHLKKQKLAIAATPTIHSGTAPIEPVATQEYLGMMISGDGNPHIYLEHRLNKARAMFGQLRHLFRSPKFPISLKHRLYRTTIVQTALYGCECWYLNLAQWKTLKQYSRTHNRILRNIRDPRYTLRPDDIDLCAEVRKRQAAFTLNGSTDPLEFAGITPIPNSH